MSERTAPREGVLRKIMNFREINLIFIILVLVAVLWWLKPAFVSELNLRSLTINLATNLVVVIGMALVIISGGIDLSVGSVVALSSAVTTVLFRDGMPVAAASVCGLLVSVCCGVFNGYLVAYHKLPPFIVSMSMMSIARGLCYILTTGTSISLVNKLPQWFNFIGGGYIGKAPFLVLTCVALGLIADVLFRKSPILRLVYYVGSNERAAAFSGISTRRVKLAVYVTTALLSGIAGQMFLSRFSYATPNVGNGLELTMIASCCIGGVSMEGGEGTVLGSMLGVVLMALITNGMILNEVSVYWQQFVMGVILISAVILDYVRVRRAAARKSREA
ncbi:MAG: ABC transporter permease [Synergistaceae bacterium]|nr:ABC transporter permease [Synergistaceae bacterium]